MGILVNTKNEQEEKVLLAFLDSLNYNYQSDNHSEALFLEQYNNELNEADAEVASGKFVEHNDVELFFQNRRKAVQ